MCASMSPPEPIEELNDQQLSVIKKLRTAMTTCLVFVAVESASIKTLGYFITTYDEDQDKNEITTYALRVLPG